MPHDTGQEPSDLPGVQQSFWVIHDKSMEKEWGLVSPCLSKKKSYKTGCHWYWYSV